jgi:hypothetical protein
VLYDSNPKFKRLISGRCRYCHGKFFTAKRTGRPQLFCGKKCRQAEFRFVTGLRRSGFEPEGTVALNCDETPQKSRANSKVSKVGFADRGYGIVGPARVIDIEVGTDRNLRLATEESSSADPRASKFIAQIPADLSIPAFLKRSPT